MLWGFTEKSNFQDGGGGHEKTVYRDIAENGGLRQFAELRRGLAKKKGFGVFEVTDTPMHTMVAL